MENWLKAAHYFDKNDFQQSKILLKSINNNSKISYNLGIMCSQLGEFEEAISHLKNAIHQDPFLAIAQFQLGVIYYQKGILSEAYNHFNLAIKAFRDTPWIDYTQIGLKSTIFACEAHFNKAICCIRLNKIQEFNTEINLASEKAITKEHNEIMRTKNFDYPLYECGMDVIFRPVVSNNSSRVLAKVYQSPTIPLLKLSNDGVDDILDMYHYVHKQQQVQQKAALKWKRLHN